MDIWGVERKFIFMFAGGMDIFVPGRATYEPRPPLYRGGYPLPLLPPALSRQTSYKKIPLPVLLHLQPVPWFAPAAALLLATISLNTYLANREVTYYRSFAAASGCSASILYLRRSLLRL